MWFFKRRSKVVIAEKYLERKFRYFITYWDENNSSCNMIYINLDFPINNIDDLEHVEKMLGPGAVVINFKIIENE